MPATIKDLHDLYKTNPSLRAHLNILLNIADADVEDLSEGALTNHVARKFRNATPETVDLLVMRSKLFLFMDEASDLKITAATINEFKNMLKTAGAVAGVHYTDNSSYYDFISDPTTAATYAEKVALFTRIMAKMRAKDRSDIKCKKAMDYLTNPRPAFDKNDQLPNILRAVTGMINSEERDYKKDNKETFNRKLEHRDFQININNDYSAIHLPEGLSATLLIEKVAAIQKINDPNKTGIGDRLFKDFNGKIRAILLQYQVPKLAADKRGQLDNELKAVLTVLAVKLRENDRFMTANELMAAIYQGEYQDDKFNRIFKKVRPGEAEDPARSPDVVLPKVNAFFDKLKGYRNDLKQLFKNRGDQNLAAVTDLPEDVQDILGANNVAACIDALDRDNTAAAGAKKQRFVSTMERLRRVVRDLEALDAANTALPAPDGEIVALRGEKFAQFQLEYARLTNKSVAANPNSFVNGRVVLPATLAEQARIAELSRQATALKAETDDLVEILEDIPVDPTNYLQVKARRQVTARAPVISAALQTLIDSLAAPAAGVAPAQRIADAEKRLGECQAGYQDLDDMMAGRQPRKRAGII
jgi:hypothetical protein